MVITTNLETPEERRRRLRRETQRRYRAKHLERERERGRIKVARWKKAHPELARQRDREYRQRRRLQEPELVSKLARERGRRWRANNPELARANVRRWAQRNPEKERANNLQKRIRRRKAPGYYTKTQIAARIAYYGERCWICGNPYECIDHVIPIARGGSHWPSNLRPACTRCNARKKDRDWRNFLLPSARY